MMEINEALDVITDATKDNATETVGITRVIEACYADRKFLMALCNEHHMTPSNLYGLLNEIINNIKSNNKQREKPDRLIVEQPQRKASH